MDDESNVPQFAPDSPKSTAIVTTHKEAKALARSLFGDAPPDQMRYICMSCGWDKTLQFDEAEMSALGGDLTSYTGPCATCGFQMLVPHGSILAGTNIEEAAQQNFSKQIDTASDLVLDKVEKRVTDFMTGAVGGGGARSKDAPVSRDDLPDESTVGTK